MTAKTHSESQLCALREIIKGTTSDSDWTPGNAAEDDCGEYAEIALSLLEAWEEGGYQAARRVLATAQEMLPELSTLLSAESGETTSRDGLARFSAATKPVFVETNDVSPRDLGIVRTSELLEQDFPKPGWIVDNLIPEGQLSFIVSDGGVGKSWLLLTLAETLVVGKGTFLGHDCTACSVVYVDMELDCAWYADRIKKIQAGLQSHGGVDQQLGCEIFYIERPRLSLDEAKLFLDREEPLSDDARETAFDYLRAAITSTGARLLIIDPIAELWGEVDENNASQTAQVCRALRAVASDTGAAIIIAHHTNKGRIEERGSTAIRNAAAAMFSLMWDDVGEQRLRKLITNKVRHGREPETAYLDFRHDGDIFSLRWLSKDEYLARMEEGKAAQAQQDLDDVLEIVGAKSPSHYNRAKLLKTLQAKGMSKRRAEAAVKQAEDDGLVVTEKGARNAKLYAIAKHAN